MDHDQWPFDGAVCSIAVFIFGLIWSTSCVSSGKTPENRSMAGSPQGLSRNSDLAWDVRGEPISNLSDIILLFLNIRWRLVAGLKSYLIFRV